VVCGSFAFLSATARRRRDLMRHGAAENKTLASIGTCRSCCRPVGPAPVCRSTARRKAAIRQKRCDVANMMPGFGYPEGANGGLRSVRMVIGLASSVSGPPSRKGVAFATYAHAHLRRRATSANSGETTPPTVNDLFRSPSRRRPRWSRVDHRARQHAVARDKS